MLNENKLFCVRIIHFKIELTYYKQIDRQTTRHTDRLTERPTDQTTDPQLEPPRAKIGPGEGRVAGSLNVSDVKGGGDVGQIFTRSHCV